MRTFTARDRAVGNWFLAAMFTLAALAAAPRTWELVRTEGLTLRSGIWLFAMAGFVSLIWRTTRAAIRPADRASPPA